jgi:excisionase family DNA binding protein
MNATGTESTQRRTDLLRVDEVAEQLQISIRSVERLADRGHLPRVRLGYRSVRFRPADVEALIENFAASSDRELPAMRPG